MIDLNISKNIFRVTIINDKSCFLLDFNKKFEIKLFLKLLLLLLYIQCYIKINILKNFNIFLISWKKQLIDKICISK